MHGLAIVKYTWLTQKRQPEIGGALSCQRTLAFLFDIGLCNTLFYHKGCDSDVGSYEKFCSFITSG